MKLQPLPEYSRISVEDIPKCSALLYYGAMPLTVFYGNRRHKHPYKPAAYHAAFYIEEGRTLQVGKFKVIQDIREDFTEKRRIDVVIYRDIPPEIRALLEADAYNSADKPKWGYNHITYGVWDFLRFEPLLRWLPKSKRDICSEDVWKRFKRYGVMVAHKPAKTEVAPWDIFEYALENPGRCEVHTVHVGRDFKAG
jgi:hypothetical protein